MERSPENCESSSEPEIVQVSSASGSDSGDIQPADSGDLQSASGSHADDIHWGGWREEGSRLVPYGSPVPNRFSRYARNLCRYYRGEEALQLPPGVWWVPASAGHARPRLGTIIRGAHHYEPLPAMDAKIHPDDIFDDFYDAVKAMLQHRENEARRLKLALDHSLPYSGGVQSFGFNWKVFFHQKRHIKRQLLNFEFFC